MSDTSMEVLHGLKQTLNASADANSNTIIGPKEAREAANAISDIEARANADAEKRKRESGLQSLEGEAVTVECKPSGGDDTAAIQAAIDEVGKAGGGTVRLD